MAFFDLIVDDLNTQDMDFEDVDTSSPEYGDLDSQIDNGNDDSLPNEDWSWLDNYVYFGNNHLPDDTNLDVDDNMDLDDNNHENHNHTTHKGKQISFKGYWACGVKGCPCGGYVSKDSGLVCRNCPHTFAQHN